MATASVFLIGCEKKANDWLVEPGNERLFKPLIFEMVKVGPTEVQIKYTQSVSADKYIFEFSKDSLQFTNISHTVEILADTLTAFAESTSPMKVEYRTTFSELDGTTGYSVRMKCVDTLSGKESKYSQFYFETGAEQLFTDWTTYTDKIQIYWTQTNRVTNVKVSHPITGEVLADRVLTAEEKSSASLLVENLMPGTNYAFTIYNNNVVRGRKVLKTSGLEGALIVQVNPGDVVADLLANAVAQGKPNITLLFKGGETYEIGVLTVPAGVNNISFTGAVDAGASKPLLNIRELKLTDLAIGKIWFESVEMSYPSASFLMAFSTNNMEIDEFSFVNCDISKYTAVVRLSNNQIKLKKIAFDNCMIDRTGGWGVVNVGGNNVKLDTISFKNSTITDISTQLMDVRAAVPHIYIGNCTFVNLNSSLTQLMRFDTKNLPLSVVTEANIIAGNNAGAKINSFSFDVSTTGLTGSFGGSYRTNDLTINKYDFPNITIFNGSTYDLFVDPANKDFTIKPESGFGGRGSAGAPRWFD